MIKRLLIANRGEIAIRIARTCRKLGVRPFGVYSEADRSSLHVKYCDEAIDIGGRLPSESYLRQEKMIDAAKKLGCDAVHPGYGFLSENPSFARACRKSGLVFVGPPIKALELSGDKVKAREAASRVAPVVEGKEVRSVKEASRFASKEGYPIIIKAAKGGGGRGLRIVKSSGELKRAFESSRSESLLSFGSPRVYVEKYIERTRHIEVQILADEERTVQLGERECSVQRRHQKLIEETPSPALDKGLRERMSSVAIAIMEEVGYENAGTVEFLFSDGRFFFMEINARIQVEHPVTEAVTGVDIVQEQLLVASGKGLGIGLKDVKPKGHAIECRINAEHPLTFVPYPGRVEEFSPPSSAGVRVDTFVYPGYAIPPFYDSLLAKLICKGKDRIEAMDRAKNALTAFRIAGIPSTIPFHISALNDRRFVRGAYDTSFVEGVKNYATREGEAAAAIFSQLPKKANLVQEERDQWMDSRFDWVVG